MSETILSIKNLTHVYNSASSKAIKAVNDVSFDIFKGETFGLVGESGCGKTTTGKMIVKLLNISSGHIVYKGKDIDKLKNKSEILDYHKDVQMIFQDPYASLDPRMKVRDIIAEGIRIHGLARDSRDIDKQVFNLLARVGLNADYATRYPHEFSGGQRQRIGIRRALATKPEFIVCDEPISALDVSVQAQIVNLLKDIQKKSGISYLFIAHDLSMVKYISDRIGVMYAGRLVELGSADRVYNNPLHPYTQALISAIPHPDPIEERTRTRITYTPKENKETAGKWQEAEPGHFVMM